MTWKNVQYENGKYRTSSGGGGGASSLVDLDDTDINNPQNGQPLRYDETSQKWINGADNFPPLIYSTAEREVGVWTDGKPLYQKVFSGTYANGDTELDISWGITGIQLVNMWGVLIPSDNPANRVIIGSNFDASNLVIFQGVDGSHVIIKRGNSAYFGSTPTAYVVCTYTKSSDTPGAGTWTTQGGYAHHYSTNERVVGTWVDGKPVYEITVENTTTRDGSVSTSQSVSTGASDIKELIDLRGAASYGANTAWLPFTFSDNASSGLTNSRVKIIAVGNDGNVFFEIGNNYNGANCINKVIITIRYTKTTD